MALKLVEERDVIAVQPMTESHALALFKTKLGVLSDDNNTAELAAALEFMPLAIVQAAAYISQRAPRYSVRRYLEEFRKSDRKKISLLNCEGGHLRRDWEAKNSIIITWQILFEHLYQTWLSAADLLSFLSFFDRQGIPEALVRNRADTGNSHRSYERPDKEDDKEDNEDRTSESSKDDGFEDDIQILRNYSFISIDTDGNFEMHALVQLATRTWLEASGQLEKWKQQYIKSLSAEFPTGEYQNWKKCQALFPHAKSAVTQQPRTEGALREWALLLHNAAWYMWRKGSIIEAEKLSTIAMEIRKKILGQEHKETLRSMGMVGLAKSLGGQWDQAEKLQVQVMETCKTVFGAEHPDTLTSIANLASTFWDQGRWDEAEKLDVQVLEICKKVLGVEHPHAITSMNNLAVTWNTQGRRDEAVKMMSEVLEKRRRILGEEHPFTKEAAENLADLSTSLYTPGAEGETAIKPTSPIPPRRKRKKSFRSGMQSWSKRRS